MSPLRQRKKRRRIDRERTQRLDCRQGSCRYNQRFKIDRFRQEGHGRQQSERILYGVIILNPIPHSIKNYDRGIRIQSGGPLMKRLPRVAVNIEERYSAMVPNSFIHLKLTEQTSVISICRGKKDREPRNSGAVFRYFAINAIVRVINILRFRYLSDSRYRKAPAKTADLPR
jgi:hypothetical protein